MPLRALLIVLYLTCVTRAAIDVFNATAVDLDEAAGKYSVLVVAYCKLDKYSPPAELEVCKDFREEYKLASVQAEKLQLFLEDGEVGFAMVDMSLEVNKELEAERFSGLTFYPALEVYHQGKTTMNGVPSAHRFAQAMLRPIIKAIRPGHIATYVRTIEQAQVAVSAGVSSIIVGVFEKDSASYQHFQKACEQEELSGYHCLWSDTDEVQSFFNVKKPSIRTLRFAQIPPFVFDLDESHLDNYNNLKLFMEQSPAPFFGKGTSFRFTGHPKYLYDGDISGDHFYKHYHFLPGTPREDCGFKKSAPPCRELRQEERDVDLAAVSAKGDFGHHFVYFEDETTHSDGQYASFIKWFGITKDMLPCSLIFKEHPGSLFNLQPHSHFLLPNATLRAKIDLQDMVRNGTAIPVVRSEDASCTSEKEHQTLVGSMFEQEVLNQDKDILLVIYDEKDFITNTSQDEHTVGELELHIAAVQAAAAELKGVETVNFHVMNTNNDIKHPALPIDFGPYCRELRNKEPDRAWAVTVLFRANQTAARPFVFVHADLHGNSPMFVSKWDVLDLVHCYAHHQSDAFSTTCKCTDDEPPQQGACDSKDVCVEVPRPDDGFCETLDRMEVVHKEHYLAEENFNLQNHENRVQAMIKKEKEEATKPKTPYVPRRPNPIAEMQRDIADRFKQVKAELEDDLKSMTGTPKVDAEEIAAQLSQDDFDDL